MPHCSYAPRQKTRSKDFRNDNECAIGANVIDVARESGFRGERRTTRGGVYENNRRLHDRLCDSHFPEEWKRGEGGCSEASCVAIFIRQETDPT